MTRRQARRHVGRPGAAILLVTSLIGMVSTEGITQVAAVTPPVPTPAATVRAVLGAFNTANCARIYTLTVPWTRPQSQDASIAACQQGFAQGRQEGVTLLRLTANGPGRYLGPRDGAYRQPLLLRRVMDDRAVATRETLQLVRWRGHWYVLALW